MLISKALKKILMLTVEWVVGASCVVFICGYSLSMYQSSDMFSDSKLIEHIILVMFVM